ncbi:MAG TPA: hypothetical protein DIW31_00270 [Bacteroidales bacterium]|nr:hypothetical protein [Bacteroidales bacterium]
MNESLLKLRSWKYFLMVIGFSALLAFSFNYLFFSDGIYYQSFGEKLATDRIADMVEQSQKWQWLGYVFIPIVVLIRVSFTAICIYTGQFLANLKVRFRDLFKVALIADFVFVLAGLVKLVILIFFKEVSTLDDLQFQPLSLMEVFDKKEVDALFIYPLSLVSIFEALYWFALAWLLTGVIDKPFGNSLKTVASSYGTGLLLWVLFVMFLTVNLSS